MVLTITRTKKCVNVMTLAGLRGLFRQIERRRSKQSTSYDSYELIFIEVKEDKIFVPQALKGKTLRSGISPSVFRDGPGYAKKESMFRIVSFPIQGRGKI
jgi:hypothetical protein